MLRQLLVGAGVSVCNITIHALVMTIVVEIARFAGGEKKSHPELFLMAVMIPTVMVLMTTHVLEVFVWLLAYAMFDAGPAGADLGYLAFTNYTTLRRHRSRGALAAARPDHRDERRAVVWMVDCGCFRGAAENASCLHRYAGRTGNSRWALSASAVPSIADVAVLLIRQTGRTMFF